MKPLQDQEARRIIEKELDRTLVVEAAAGTGKTTCLVSRIIAVLAGGHARVGSLVAVTFTEKAAGELKLKLRAELERARRGASDETVRTNLEDALARLEEARVGTIHGFCADLLRERSVEAQVDPDFEILPEGESERTYRDAFNLWLQRRLDDPPEGVRRSLRREARMGGAHGPVARLRRAGWTLAEWRDFPAPWRRDAFDRVRRIDQLVDALGIFAALTERCANKSSDRFYRDTERVRVLHERVRVAERVRDRDHDGLEAQLVQLAFDRDFARVRRGAGHRYGEGLSRDEVHAAHQDLVGALQDFAEHADADLAARLREELRESVEAYEERKRRAGRLDFVDLLALTRDLLRDQDDVRREYQARFSHLFVDEFQDTDPLQAEILMLLAADDPSVTDWLQARPAPGKLFLVGDPKQSIYRFRRADVGTYLDVKERLRERGAEVLHLTTSFRSTPTIQRVVNAAFRDLMDGEAEAHQAEYVPLTPYRDDPLDQPSVVALPVPWPYSQHGNLTKGAIEESLPDAVGAYVKWLVDESGWTVTEGGRKPVPLAPRHICLLFRRLSGSSYRGNRIFSVDVTRAYADALEARGIHHLLVGGRSFHEKEEVEAIRTALTAIEWPDDELSVYATLKGPLFAIGDEELLGWRHGLGKRLHPFRLPDDGEVPDAQKPVLDALRLLAKLHRRRNARPVGDTLGHLLDATRAHATFALRPAGEQSLANVLHIGEEARRYEASGGLSFRGFVERLAEGATEGRASEAPILEDGSEGVRIMTVHKAKGLEFPVVILCDLTANLAIRRASRHIDPEKGLCALTLAGWSPVELLEAQEVEGKREVAEGVRLAYVAATRARDLLVVPALGMGMQRFGDLDDPTQASWCAPVANALFPDPDAWRDASSAPGCPSFGRDAIWMKDPTMHVPTTVQPGIHRIGPDIGGHDAVWWDPDALDLGIRPTPGMRHEELLKPTSDEIVEADGRRFTDWQKRHDKVLADGSRPSRRVMTTTAYVRPDPVADEPAAHPDATLDAEMATVEVIELPVDAARPAGARFGAVVHAALATVPLDADRDAVDEHVALAARILGAPDEEREPAREAIVQLLAHPLLRRAAKAEGSGRCRRESPVALRDAEGVVVDGVIDLAFEDDDGWTVVDFKTDREMDRDLDAYRRQVVLYARAVAAATGAAARGVLVRG